MSYKDRSLLSDGEKLETPRSECWCGASIWNVAGEWTSDNGSYCYPDSDNELDKLTMHEPELNR